MSFTTNDSLKQYTTILQRHTDAYGNNVCEEIKDELKQVIDREVLLEQIPHPYLGIAVVYPEKNIVDGAITNLVLKEIHMKETINNKNEIKIDYNTGKIMTHYSLEGKYLKISYWGRGHSLIHSSRVYTQLDEYGDVRQTLEQMIDIIYKLGDTNYIVRVLQDIENARGSLLKRVDYPEINERLNAIEEGIMDYLNDHLKLNQSLDDVVKNIDSIRDLAEDVDYRMGILENNYLNPNFIKTEEIDSILGGLK